MGRSAQRKPLPTESAEIEKFSHDGRGIARIKGKTTFIEGALPGESVLFQYTKIKKDFDEGRVISLSSPPSPLRVEPRCNHYEICGGCSLQHLKTEAQIKIKEEALLDLLLRIAKVRPETLLAPLRAEQWNYRSKARLSVRYVEKKGKTLIGFREKYKPSFIAEINQCPILTAKVDAQLQNLAALIDSLKDPKCIAQIEVAAGDEEHALIFRNMSPLSEEDKEKFCRFGEEQGFKIYLQPGGVESIAVIASAAKQSSGLDGASKGTGLLRFARNDDHLHYTLPEENIRFAFHPSDFTQINPGLNRKMVQLALELLDPKPDDQILDLFCGLGNFSLPMARRAKKVIGVEGSSLMVSRALTNAEANQCFNTEFYAYNLDAPEALAALKARMGEANFHCNKVLIDPPRTGAFEIVKQIDSIMPERIVYVSCNPATLARDTDILVNQHGYRLRAVGVMDMFPHTMHVESIALFDKQGQ